MRTVKLQTGVIAIIAVLFSLTAWAGEMNLLHEFSGGGADGALPLKNVLVYNDKIYGMTLLGGDLNYGVAYRVNLDGSAFELIHEFAGQPNDGRDGRNSLIVSNDVLYSTTWYGGATDKGTVFKMDPDGGNFSLIHSFAGGVDDGLYADSSVLAISGSTLYGMTAAGGDADKGTVYKVDAGGTGFALIHEFAGGNDDGRNPNSSLVLSGTTLYGMTYYGGDADKGVIFKMETSGGAFSLLHEFAGGVHDGANPFNDLVLAGSTLYGMTALGGDEDKGIIFKINTDGTDYAVLHEFLGGAEDGATPYGPLTINGDILYGTTVYGGDSNLGTLFQMGIDGSDFSVLYEFSGGVDDGSQPRGNVYLHNDVLYGMTTYGGDSDKGTIFGYELGGGGDVPEPSTLLLLLPLIIIILRASPLKVRAKC